MSDGRSIFRVDLVYDQPFTDDRRRGDCEQSLEYGNRCGALGNFFFLMLQSDQYEKQWHYHTDGNQVHTMLRKRNPIMDSFRKYGLHLPEQKASPPIKHKGVDMDSSGGYSDGLYGFLSRRNTCVPGR